MSARAAAGLLLLAGVGRTDARQRLPLLRQQRAPADPPLPSIVDSTWKFYPQPLSHFNPGHTPHGNSTFMQRVCLVDKYWATPTDMMGGGAADTGPILFCKSTLSSNLQQTVNTDYGSALQTPATRAQWKSTLITPD